MHTILVVDDDKYIRDMVRDYLTAEGFRVVTAAEGREALHVARYEKPSIILLDVMMPEMNGYDFMHHYGKEADTPIILLTAKIEENDKVLGLELGADDYITKPFSMRELTARVRAMTRRMQKMDTDHEVIRADNIMMDIGMRQVKIDGETIDLTPSEFHILMTLMRSPGRVFSRLELIDEEDQGFEGFERSVDAHIRRLRAKIEPDRKNPRYVETVYGFGYRFSPPVG